MPLDRRVLLDLPDQLALSEQPVLSALLAQRVEADRRERAVLQVRPVQMEQSEQQDQQDQTDLRVLWVLGVLWVTLERLVRPVFRG